MSEQWTQTHSDNLADIIWWIKGYLKGQDDSYSTCAFNSDHVESLRLARLNLKDKIDEPNINPIQLMVSAETKSRKKAEQRIAELEAERDNMLENIGLIKLSHERILKEREALQARIDSALKHLHDYFSPMLEKVLIDILTGKDKS